MKSSKQILVVLLSVAALLLLSLNMINAAMDPSEEADFKSGALSHDPDILDEKTCMMHAIGLLPEADGLSIIHAELGAKHERQIMGKITVKILEQRVLYVYVCVPIDGVVSDRFSMKIGG